MGEYLVNGGRPISSVAVGAGSINTTALDWDGNIEKAQDLTREAWGSGVDFLLLPELCLSGYGCEDWFASPETWFNAKFALLEVASCVPDGMTVLVGLPLFHKNAVFNAVAVIHGPTNVLGFIPKENLAGDGIHYEPRWFEAWPAGVVSSTEIPEIPMLDGLPIGDLVFNIGGVKIACEVCEDAWVANRRGARASKQGVDILFNPSASHFAFGKQETRRRWVEEGSRAFGCAYVLANLMGNEAGRAIYDGGNMIAENGTVVAEAQRFTFTDTDLITAAIDLETNRSRQARVFSFHTSPEHDPRTIAIPWFRSNLYPVYRDNRFTATRLSKMEEFTAAVALGLYDYARKSHSRGWVISLSGGADSAACAVLCREALRRAIYARTAQVVVRELDLGCNFPEMYHEAIFTAYQPTENSGSVTREAAEAVAEGLGVTFRVLDLTDVHKAYLTMIEGGLGRETSWSTDDMALQNIQARIRAPGIWFFANERRALLISTSNRSEAAVGYATMDGDTAGGISPIAGIDKAFLREWLVWARDHIEDAAHGLDKVISQQPTAELRPPDQNQTDEGDLMPYPILDQIERLAIRDKMGPQAVYARMTDKHPEVPPAVMRGHITKFFRLWTRNQWKRERYAPSFHLDDENLDPRTWCRFPILSGGFSTELRLLNEPPKS